MQMDAVFKSLADRSRRKLLDRLFESNGQTLTELCANLDMSRQAVTKHLVALESVGLVCSERRGRQRVWTMRTQPLGEASDYLIALSQRWDRAIDRLRDFVERD